MTHAIYPGSFDPPTLGHLDVIRRAAGLFDRLTVAVLVNPDKTGLFDVPERLSLLRGATAELPGVQVDSFSGLLVDHCRAVGVTVIVKGLRAVSDFDYEWQMAAMNAQLTAPAPDAPGSTAGPDRAIETVFLPASPAFAFLSSSLIKQVAALGGDVRAMLPPAVAAALAVRLGSTPPA